MKKLIMISLAFALFISAMSFTIDESPLQKILEKLDKFNTTYPQEKVHLQTDKPYYVAGEEIWMKAYVVTATENHPSELSKILYIELISDVNQLSKKITLAIDSGKGFGQITLPVDLKSGTYRLRAYTNYMRNFDPDFFFEKPVVISNTADPLQSEALPKAKEELVVQFFPEGGDLIYGSRSKVGLKAVDQNGIGAKVAGYIIDDRQEKVAVFSTEHAGMGSFALHPVKGKHYKAVIEKNDGLKLNFSLPQILESGYTLSVNSVSENKVVGVRIAVSQDLVKSQIINLVAQCNGKVFFSTTAIADKAVLTTNIPKSKFPTGIIQFTLFVADDPVAERLIFINHNDQIKINVTPTISHGNIGQTQLNLFITDENENPLDGNFSISVVDADQVKSDENEESTIMSNLLLTSDLKGYIEQPNYYFNNIDYEKERQLDNLLLTQGWRRFIWKDVLAESEIALLNKIEKTISINGLVTDVTGKPQAKAKVLLMSVSAGYDMILDTLTDSRGRFIFDLPDVNDTVKFMIQAKLGTNSAVKIILDKGPLIAIKKPLIVTETMIAYVEDAKQLALEMAKLNPTGITLNQVTITKKELKPIENIVSSKSRNGSADYVITKERFANQTGDLFNVFYWIPGVKIQDGQIIRAKTNTVSIAPNFKGKQQPMVVILDGSELPDQDILKKIPASSVEGIEVLTSNYNTAIYDNGYWGIIIITTKLGGPDKTKFVSENLTKIANKGISIQKQFYVPANTGAKSEKILTIPQSYNKTTIHWDPNVNSNSSGKATVLVSNSKAKKYRLTVEGMDTFGKIGRKVLTYLNN